MQFDTYLQLPACKRGHSYTCKQIQHAVNEGSMCAQIPVNVVRDGIRRTEEMPLQGLQLANNFQSRAVHTPN